MEKIKIILPFVLARRIVENSKKIGKKIKKLKNTAMALFQTIIDWKMMRKSENKNYRSVSFQPDA